MRHGDGTWRWVRDRGEAEREASGRPIRMTGAISDITAQRMLEDAVLRQDRVLRVRSAANLALVRAADERTLLQEICEVAVREGGYRMAWVGYADHAPGHAVQVMASGGVIDGYLEASNISWSAHDPTGQGPAGRCIRTGLVQVVTDTATDAAFAPWREAARARGYGAVCAIPLHVRGEVLGTFVLYSAEAGAFADAEVDLLSEVGNDIAFGIAAMRDAAAVMAQQSQLALFREVIERSSDAIFLVDTSTQTFIDANAAACTSLGLTREELFAMGPHDVVVRMRDPAAMPQLIATLRKEGAIVQPSEHLRKDGTVVPVEVSLTLIAADERELLLGIARDMSERQALEAQLLQSQKLEGIGRLAGGIAHDFNNLLTVINATADLALQTLPPDSPVRSDFDEIRTAGVRAATLTGQLLAFSRRQVVRQEVLDLAVVTVNFSSLLRRVIGEDIQLDLQTPDSPAWVSADPGHLEQILLNLTLNARDAMPLGGRVTIAVAPVQLDAAFTSRHPTTVVGPHIRLAVRDTGCGMSEEVQLRAFEPFFTTKEVGQGSGLGLATVYGLIKQMNGTIWLQSALGEGTTIEMYFPTALPPAPAAPEPSGTSVSPGHETILVVEDEAAIRMVAKRVLERAGYTVRVAADAEAAIQMLEHDDTPPALLLTDVVMPGMDGNELAELMAPRFPQMRVLLTSGYSQELLAQRAAGESPFPLLSKPYSMDSLLTAVRDALDDPARS